MTGLITLGLQITANQYKKAFNVINKQKMANQDEYILQNCGKRPLFIGKRRKAYDECVASLPIVQSAGSDELNYFDPPVGGNGTILTTPPLENENFFKKYQTPIIIGAAALVGLYFITKKK